MSKIILTQNGCPITMMATDPTKSEAAPLEGAASGTEHSSLESIDAHIVQAAQRQRKAFCTMQAQFAREGHELKSKHHPTGLTLFEVTRHGQTRIFSAWHDVGAFLTQLQGARHG